MRIDHVFMSPPAITRRSFLRFGALAVLARPRLGVAEPAERSLSFYNLHTTERLRTVYWSQGSYVPESLADINRVLRDHRTGNIHEIDCALLDLLSLIRTELNSTEPYEVISGYRSPATNAMLRSHSTGVASQSLHLKGMAADVRLRGRSLVLLRKAALAMRSGGVGYYPVSRFVHIDVGRVRSW